MIDANKLKEFLETKDESPKIEFKLKYDLSGQNKNKYYDELAKDLLALTNTAGRTSEDFAYLVIGTGDVLKVDGTRDVLDVRPFNFKQEQFLKIVNARCAPPVQDVRFAEIEHAGNFYGIVEIPPSPHVHELSRNLDTPRGSWQRGSILIRRGSEVGVAGRSEIKLMEREKESWSGISTDPRTSLEQLEDFLPDPYKKIVIRKLIIGEAKNLHTELNKLEFLANDSAYKNIGLNERIDEYDKLAESLLELFVTGSYNADEGLDSVWADALTVVADTSDGGNQVSDMMMRLRRYPAMMLFYAGGIAAVAGRRYKTVAAFFHQTKVRRWRMLQNAALALPPATVVDSYDRKHLIEYQYNPMPLEYHLRNRLRNPLGSVIHTEDEYLDCFTRFEYLFALDSLAKGNGIILGSYVWESEIRRKYQQTYSYNLPVIGETDNEIEREGKEWLPFKSGIFSGVWEDFLNFKREADGKISERAQNYLFTKSY